MTRNRGSQSTAEQIEVGTYKMCVDYVVRTPQLNPASAGKGVEVQVLSTAPESSGQPLDWFVANRLFLTPAMGRNAIRRPRRNGVTEEAEAELADAP